MTKSFFIDQHGCAKNQTDGELITGFLIDAGYNQTFDAEKADLIIINSCGFIESAKKESIDAIYNVKAAYPNAKIILAGCLAERYSELMGSKRLLMSWLQSPSVVILEPPKIKSDTVSTVSPSISHVHCLIFFPPV